MKKILVLCSLLLTGLLNGQLVINEFLTSNSGILADEAGEYEDWIELYNKGDEEINLNGFCLSDDYDDPVKFKFFESAKISGHSFLIVFADEDENQGSYHAGFKLSREGEQIILVQISENDTLVIDSVSYVNQITDISYGRFPDGDSNFDFFSIPTPGESNVSDNMEGAAPPPDFSIPGGFYSGTQTIELSCPIIGSEIRYTTDCSEPDEYSELYELPLVFDTTTVIKARVYAPAYYPGPVQGFTYFVDEHFVAFDPGERLPVVSISAAPDLIWGQDAGLLYDANNQNDWEYAANIEMFEADGSYAFNQIAGIQLFGNSTRRMAQKSISVIARNEYGSNRFAYKLFDDRPFEEYKSFVLRNGGNDWSETYFRDVLSHELIRNTMDIDAQGCKQAIVYINGEFYGITSIMEKINEHYLEDHHGVDPDNIDMLASYGELVYGDTEAYDKFRGFVARNNMGNAMLFSELENQMDIQEYMNLYIAQIYISNIDMALNQKYWREKENFGKWRWIIYDTEISLGQYDYAYTTLYETHPSFNTLDFATIAYGGSDWPYYRPWSSEKIIAMLDNVSYRNDFIQSFAVHLNTTFKSQRVLSKIDSLAQNIRKEMPYQIERYGGVTVGFNPYGTHFTTMEEWESDIDTVLNFARIRSDNMRTYIANRFSLEGTYSLTPTIASSEYGTVYVQGIRVPFDSAGIYFNNIPLKVKVVPAEGYRFVRWEGTYLPDSASESIIVTLAEDAVLEAVFEPEAELMITEIFYNPAAGSGYEFIELHNPKHSTAIDLSGVIISGDVNFEFPEGSAVNPGCFAVIAADKNNFGCVKVPLYQWTSGYLNNIGGLLKLSDSQGNTLDSVNYSNTEPWPQPATDYSIELTANTLDNNLGANWQTCSLISGLPGIPIRKEGLNNLIINEFQSDNVDFLADENHEYNDWLEIVNMGDENVDIAGLFITNDLGNPCRYQIPTDSPDKTVIKPGEHKIIWADRDTLQGPLHLGFNLNKGGCEIGISGDGRTFIDTVVLSNQLPENISYGRYPDSEISWRNFERPTPGNINSLPPQFDSQPLLTVERRTDYEYEIQVSDPENDELIIGVYVLPEWLYYAGSEDAALITGRSPVGSFNPLPVKLFVTDGFSRPVSQEFSISVAVPDNYESLTADLLRIYPNPTSGLVTVEAQVQSGKVRLELLNISGQLLWTEELENTDGRINTRIDLTNFKKGLYLLNIRTENETTTQKLLLM